jgi:hypothetical protein
MAHKAKNRHFFSPQEPKKAIFRALFMIKCPVRMEKR